MEHTQDGAFVSYSVFLKCLGPEFSYFGESRYNQLLNLIATREEFGRTLAWDQQMDAKLEALTVEQVNAAFRRHVSLDQLSIVKAGDFKAAGAYQK